MFKKMILMTIAICVQNMAFANTQVPLFLRGDMNNWDAKAINQLVKVSTNTWMAKTELKANKLVKFKFSDKKWKEKTTFGQANPEQKVVTDEKLAAGIGYQWGDFKFTPSQDAIYYFYLVLTDPEHPYVMVKNSAL